MWKQRHCGWRSFRNGIDQFKTEKLSAFWRKTPCVRPASEFGNEAGNVEEYDHVYLLAVTHQRREPGYWKKRLSSKK